MASKEKKQPDKREIKPVRREDDSNQSEFMRRFKAQPFIFIGTIFILVIVVIAFVFVPAIVPEARHSGDLVFGFYNRVPIRYANDNFFFNAQQDLSRRQHVPSDDPVMIAQLWRQAFNMTVVHMGILDEVRRAGLVVPDFVVDREVASLPHFQEAGRFSAARYRAMDANTRMSLWRQVHESIKVRTYLSDLASLRTPANEITFVSSMASPQRNFNLAVFPFDSYPDSQVITFANENPNLFTMVRLSKISMSSEREARQIREQVVSGAITFEDAARAHSQDWFADRGGDMGLLMAHELMFDIRDEPTRLAIINLPRGAISDVVRDRGNEGWAFYRIDDYAHPLDVNDPSQIARARNYIMWFMRGQVEDWLMAEAERFSARAEEVGFELATSDVDITRHSFGPIPVNFGSSALFASVEASGIPELAGADTNPFFWRAAFNTPLMTASRPFVMGNNILVLFPQEESEADEWNIELIELYYPFWVQAGLEQSYHMYFLTNERLDDRFDATFWRLWGGF